MSRRREQQGRQTGRLPPIAPRDPQPPPPLRTEFAATTASDDASLKSPRTRLPPRSRSGCWTCRTRKVKCDEARPRCNQCTRLGHVCDYNPRLAFKDETAKIVEKYLGGGDPSRQWNSSQKLNLEPQGTKEADNLPPFSALTTEEDWERKAEHRAPGTYYVIANSSSFPITGDNTSAVGGVLSPREGAPSRRQSVFSTSTDAQSDDGLGRSIANIALDDDTVIIQNFEETSRQSQTASSISPALMLRLETGRISPDSPLPLSFVQGQPVSSMPGPSSLPYPVGRYAQEDLRKIHYRTVVRRHMFSIHRAQGSASPGASDMIEAEISKFPLLESAVDELAAWSLAVNGGLQNFDTQERYLEILSALRKLNSEKDLKRDGMFLTHVILLVYEISASHRSWHLHLGALLHIFQIRGASLVRRYPGIILWIINLDINALLCGSGRGSFVDFVMENDLFPTTKDLCNGHVLDGFGVPSSPSESQQLMTLYGVLGQLMSHGRQIGHLASFFRQSFEELATSESQDVMLAQIASWQQETASARLALEQTWEDNMPALSELFEEDAESLPETVSAAVEAVWFLYHSLVLYSHTSMWPRQRIDDAHAHDANAVAQCCSAILERAYASLNRGEFSQRLMVFPLFLAGFLSSVPTEKRLALDLLRLMERASIGNNTRATRRWLQRLFGDQAMEHEAGVPLGVDWIQKIQEQDFCIVHCGF